MKTNELYLEQLKNCLTMNEVRNLMRGYPIANNNSKFEDSYYLYPSPSGRDTRRYIRLNNEFLDLFFRVLCALKNEGLIGPMPLGSGRYKYHAELHSILMSIEEFQPEIASIMQLKPNTIEDISLLYLKRTYPPENMHPLTGYGRLRQLLDIGKYANYRLPPFMQLDISLFFRSESFAKLKKLHHEERRNQYIIGGTKTPYNLIDLKKIVGEAIRYIENYSDDICVATKIYIKGSNKSINPNNTINSEKFYSILYDLIKEENHEFKEPSIKSIQHQVNSIKKYSKGAKSIFRMRTPFRNAHNKLEASCVIVLLMTTGMRRSELTKLQRYPEFTNDDHYKLKRMIHKTADTENGFEHTIPIPEITEKAITILSKLSEIKDNKKEGHLLIKGITKQTLQDPDTLHRPGDLIKSFCNDLNIVAPPTPHDFRHAMAFLIAYSNKKEGLELAREFLAHTSITMTLQYMGHYNQTLREAVKELYMEESKEHAKTITNELKKDKRLYGVKAETILGDYQFTGSYAEDFIDIIDQSLMGLIEKGEIAIIQTPVCVCVHDLTSPEAMACQRGFDIKDFVGEFPKPSKCEGTICKNAVFLESQIDDMDFIPEDDELRKRLEKNRFFTDAGGFDNDPMEKILKQHREHQKRIVNG